MGYLPTYSPRYPPHCLLLSLPCVPPRHARACIQVANEVRNSILHLYGSYLSADGRAVDYKGMRADPRFRSFIDLTPELQKVRHGCWLVLVGPMACTPSCACGVCLYSCGTASVVYGLEPAGGCERVLHALAACAGAAKM